MQDHTPDLVSVLNACTPDALRALRQRLERPALNIRVPSYPGKLTRAEDQCLRVEQWWRELREAQRQGRRLQADLIAAPSRATYHAMASHHRRIRRLWREFQTARTLAGRS